MTPVDQPLSDGPNRVFAVPDPRISPDRPLIRTVAQPPIAQRQSFGTSGATTEIAGARR